MKLQKKDPEKTRKRGSQGLKKGSKKTVDKDSKKDW
jgi:hypothetical protein